MRTPLTLLLMTLAAASLNAADSLRAGFATADLTPPLGVEMGGFGYNLGRAGDGVRDKLLARAAVLQIGARRVAIIGCDLGGISLEHTRRARALIAAATGIPPESVMLGTTHTHSAPIATHWIGVGKIDQQYVEGLPARIAKAVVEASKKVEPVTMSWGAAAVEGVARNREYPGGQLDPQVRVLTFKAASGSVAGFIANYSVHPVVMAQLTHLFTGDLAGASVNLVMERHPGSVGIFLQGSSGDINPIYAHMPQDESLQKLDLLASRLAGSITQAMDGSHPEPASSLSSALRPIALPQIVPDKDVVIDRLRTAEYTLKQANLTPDLSGYMRFRADSARAAYERFNRQPLDRWDTEVQAIAVGPVLIVANPGETFVQFGLATMDAFPGRKVMVTGYTNDYVGYIPAKDRYIVHPDSELSYPAYMTPWLNGEFRFREDVGDVLVREMVAVGQAALHGASSALH